MNIFFGFGSMLRMTEMFIPGSDQDWCILSQVHGDLKQTWPNEEIMILEEDSSLPFGIVDGAKQNLHYKNLLQPLGIDTKNNNKLYKSCVGLYNFKDFKSIKNDRDEEDQLPKIPELLHINHLPKEL